MPLTKKYCENCRDRIKLFQTAKKKRLFNLRDETFENGWKKLKLVFCPHAPVNTTKPSRYGIHFGVIKITEEPPEGCPYILEHTMNKEDEDEDEENPRK
jgi:hypothetical protein